MTTHRRPRRAAPPIPERPVERVQPPAGRWLVSGRPDCTILKRPVPEGEHRDERMRWRLAVLCRHGRRALMYFYEEADCDQYRSIVRADCCSWTGCGEGHGT